MHRRLSLISVWVATFLMLLSTVVMHHHHYERTCIVLEHCDADGSDVSGDGASAAEEGHSHQETDRSSCRIHQLHRFIINADTVRDTRRHIFGGISLAAAQPSSAAGLPATAGSVSVKRQHTATPLGGMAPHSISRRGPPQSSL